MSEHVSVYVTAPDMGVARRIATHVVDARLAACANILPVQSIYRWQGALQDEAEVAMLLKTRRALVPQLAAAIKVLHPYEVPCIVALDLVAGHAPYLAWIDEQTRA